MDPKQLDESPVKEEATICCALTRMNIACALNETYISKCFSFRAAWFAADENMVESNGHFCAA
jgi:hypothetical protein